MISPKMVAIIAVIWVIGLLLGSTFSYNNLQTTWAGSATGNSISTGGYGQFTDIEYLLNFKNATQTIDVLGIIPLPVPNGTYFKVFFGVLVLRFSFLVSNPYGEMFWAFVLLPFSLITVVGLVLTFLSIMRGNISW